MPFIWNDTRFDFLDEKESYDTAEYTIARKLYVELVPTTTVSFDLMESRLESIFQLLFVSSTFAIDNYISTSE